MSIDLTVTPAGAKRRLPLPVPVEGTTDVDGQPVHVLLFVDDDGGELEFVWYVERADRLPEAHELQLARWREGRLVNLD